MSQCLEHTIPSINTCWTGVDWDFFSLFKIFVESLYKFILNQIWFFCSLFHLYNPQIFIDPILCAKHYFRLWDTRTKKANKVPFSLVRKSDNEKVLLNYYNNYRLWLCYAGIYINRVLQQKITENFTWVKLIGKSLSERIEFKVRLEEWVVPSHVKSPWGNSIPGRGNHESKGLEEQKGQYGWSLVNEGKMILIGL